MEYDTVINKYNGLKNKALYTQTFATVGKKIFNDNDLDIDDIGLYVFLVTRSRQSLENDGIGIVDRIDSLSIYKMVYRPQKLQGKYREIVGDIEERINRLEDQGFIERIVNTIGEQAIKIPQNDLDGGFAKLYAPGIKVILRNLTGKKMLRKLAVYAAFRTLIFEGSTGTFVIERAPMILSKMLGLSKVSMNNHLKWLRENYVLAYFKCKRASMNDSWKQYYSDIVQYDRLVINVKAQYDRGFIKEIIE